MENLSGPKFPNGSMNRAAETIAAIYNKYNADSNTEVDVCTWVRNRIYEKLVNAKPGSDQTSIKFKGALLEFIEQKALFCIYFNTDEGQTLDITFPLAMYIRREYGVELTNSFSNNINLGFTEAMELAEQVTDDICVWVCRAGETVTA